MAIYSTSYRENQVVKGKNLTGNLTIPDVDNAVTLTNVNALTTAINALVHGLPNEVKVVSTVHDIGATAGPIPSEAQRGSKWQVNYLDASDNPRRFEIPTANPSLLSTGSDVLDITAGAGLAFVNALTTAGFTGTVQSIVYVNRSIQ